MCYKAREIYNLRQENCGKQLETLTLPLNKKIPKSVKPGLSDHTRQIPESYVSMTVKPCITYTSQVLQVRNSNTCIRVVLLYGLPMSPEEPLWPVRLPSGTLLLFMAPPYQWDLRSLKTTQVTGDIGCSSLIIFHFHAFFAAF